MTSSQFRCTAIAILTLALLPDAPAQAQKNGATPSYTFTDLGGLPGLSYKQSGATAINDAGQIVGFSDTVGTGPGGSGQHPVLWTKDSTGKYVITDLRVVAGNNGNFAYGINRQGEVAGKYVDSTTGVATGFLIRPVTVNGVKVWYQDLDLDGFNDLMTNLGPVTNQGPLSISDHTQVTAGPNLVQFDPATGGEIVTTLPTGGYAWAINSNRQAAGSFGAGTALWQVDAGGNVQSMLALSPLPGYTGSVGNCVNALGQVAGNSYAPGGQSLRATLWQNGLNPTDLGSLSNKYPYNDAGGINTVNGVLQVVGFENIWNLGFRAFIWKNGVMTDLNSLISASGVILRQANAINAQGQIVGFADVKLSKYNTETHGFLLTPK